MTIIDLSLPIQNSISEPIAVKVKKMTHDDSAKKFVFLTAIKKDKNILKKIINIFKYFIGTFCIKKNSFPDGKFITKDIITLSTHNGTHVDAPYHFGPLQEGKPAMTIDEIPLEWFIGNGVKLDLQNIKPCNEIKKEDIVNALKKINYTLKQGDIVLIWTGCDRKYGSFEYFTSFPGMSKDAIEYIIGHGIRVIGIDTFSFDRPFRVIMDDFFINKNSDKLWPAHLYGREKTFTHIEKLCNLDKIPSLGFTIQCFPIKIKDGDAAWTRAIAII